MSSRTRFLSISIPSLAVVLLLIATALVAVLPASPARAAAIPSGFPNSGNTGLTNPSALKVHNGPLTVTQDGAVIQNLEIRGKVTINARNVVMRNVWVYTSNAWSIYVQPGKSLLIEDSEIGHPSHPGFRGIGGNNVTARRLDIHHVEDGIKADNNSLYERVYCHDLASPASSPHADCFQDDGGHSNYTVRNSTLDARFANGTNGNAAIIVKSDLGSISNATFEGNYINGGIYVIFVRNGGYGMPAGVKIANNRFGPDRKYGLLSSDGAVSWYNNVWDGNGKTASPGGSDTRFTDVSSRYVFYNDIEWLADKGITKGCNSSGSRFCPDRAVTRGEMAAFLVRALGLPGAKRDWFRDDNGAPFEDAINRVADAGISKGCNPPANDRFCPDSKVSRGQMAAFLVRAKGYSNNGGGNLFVDDNEVVYENDIDRLGTAGVTKGCNPPANNRFCPNDSVTRGQMAAFLRRAFG
jgi:hypothetical protein